MTPALPLGPGYFSSGVWAADGPLRLRSCSCVVCGLRLATWESFRAHRAAGTCRPLQEHGAALQPGWQRGEMDAADRDALSALLLQLPDPDPIDTAQWAEETLT